MIYIRAKNNVRRAAKMGRETRNVYRILVGTQVGKKNATGKTKKGRSRTDL